jgi:hypothetical protein
MHKDLYQASILTARAVLDSAKAVEDTCLPDLAYSNARLQPRPFLFLQLLSLALWD